MPARAADFSQVQAIFFAAVELPVGERERYVASATTDEMLRSEVRSLLEAAHEDDFLGAPAVLPREVADGDSHSFGRRVGPFTLGRRIGIGGMGVVYEAEQDQPRRTVAMKLIRPELASDETIARFRREAELLGRLQHPGIAMVFEAGADRDPDDPDSPPQPYCAMELVHGERITTWADARSLSIGDRMELLARVCDAVDHAHRRDVLHRDLKPANILVTDDGQPKILDFGVARALKSVATSTVHTLAGDLVGTLGWMSPEQVRGRVDEIDARSDVYALGVIGYELFGGRAAFDLDGLSISEAIRRLCDVEPAPLGRIRPDVPSDLSLIVGKAIMKEASARYASAAAMADDLRACRDERPVTARAPTTMYRTMRFVRRNRLLVSLAGSAFVLLAGTSIVAATGWRREAVQADRTQRVNSYLLGAIGTLNPGKLGSSEISLKKALDEIGGRLGPDLEAAPDLAAAVHQALGQQYLELGSLHEAEWHFHAAANARKVVFGEDAPETTTSMLTRGQVLRRLGRVSEAVEVLEETLAHLRARQAPAVDIAEALNNLATAYVDAGRTADARARLEEALALVDSSEPNRLGRSFICANLAAIDMQSGAFENATRLVKEAMDLRVASEGETLDTAKAMARWAGTMMHAAEPSIRDEAIAMLERSVASMRRVLPADHDELVQHRESLARTLARIGRRDEAIELIEENADALEVGGRAVPETLIRNLQFLANLLDAPEHAHRRAEVIGRLGLYGVTTTREGGRLDDLLTQEPTTKPKSE